MNLTEEELINNYDINYQKMVNKDNSYQARVKDYNSLVLILDKLLLKENKSYFKYRLDYLNLLYYGFKNFKFEDNANRILKTFHDFYKLNMNLLELKSIDVNQLKIIVQMKHELNILFKSLPHSKHEEMSDRFTELKSFKLKDVKIERNSSSSR